MDKAKIVWKMRSGDPCFEMHHLYLLLCAIARVPLFTRQQNAPLFVFRTSELGESQWSTAQAHVRAGAGTDRHRSRVGNANGWRSVARLSSTRDQANNMQNRIQQNRE
eukprot:6174524-Pleurochrysis_carterae.AAC.1